MITLQDFGGLHLRYAKDRLPDNAAQNCFDVDFSNGTLIGLPANQDILTHTYPVRGIHVHSEVDGADKAYFWPYDVHAVRSPVQKDDYKRFYWTGVKNDGSTEFRFGLVNENPSLDVTQSYKVGVINSSIWDNTLSSLGIVPEVITAGPSVAMSELQNSTPRLWLAGADGALIKDVSSEAVTSFAGSGDQTRGWYSTYNLTLSRTLESYSEYIVSTIHYETRKVDAYIEGIGPIRGTVYSLGGVDKFFESDQSSGFDRPIGATVEITLVNGYTGVSTSLGPMHFRSRTLFSVDNVDLPTSTGGSSTVLMENYQFCFVWDFDCNGQHYKATWYVDPNLSNTLDIGTGISGSFVKVDGTHYRVDLRFGSDSTAYESRAYAATFVNNLGEESELSLPVEVTLRPNTERVGFSLNETTLVTLATSAGLITDRYPIHGLRIYRSVGGEFFYVGTIKPAATSPQEGENYLVIEDGRWIDNVTDAALGDACSTTDYISDASELQGLRGLTSIYNGILAAFKDNEVWLSEPYKPWAWKRKNVISLPHKVIALAPHEQGILVLTELRNYYMSGATPSEFVPTALSGNYPCVDKRSVLPLGDKTVFVSTDGPVFVQGLTQTLEQVIVTRDDWRNLMGDGSMLLSAYGYRILGYWKNNLVDSATGKSRGGMMFDQNSGNWTFITDVPMYAHHLPPRSFSLTHDALVFADGTNTLKIFSHVHGTRKNWLWHSKDFVMPYAVNFGVVQLFGTGTVCLKVYADGNLVFNQNLAASLSGAVYRLPAGFRASVWSFSLESISSGAEIRRAIFAHNMQELRSA